MAKELSVKQLQAKKVRINADIVKVLEKGKSLATERDAVDALLLVQAELLRKEDRKSTRLNSSHRCISYAVFCLKKKKKTKEEKKKKKIPHHNKNDKRDYNKKRYLRRGVI